MGSRMAPPYANIFLGKIEQEFIFHHSKYIKFWRRFLDDIFFIWVGKKESLLKFINYTNDFHPTLTFNFEYSPQKINFLDLTIYLDKKRKLCTTIFRKKTDKFLILHHNSIHPPHVRNNIIFNETLRYIKNITKKYLLTQELAFLRRVFMARGYPKPMIIKQMARACAIPRPTLLTKKPKKPNPFLNRIVYKAKFGPQSDKLKRYISSAWKRTVRDPELHKIFPGPPIPIRIRNKNLTDVLIRTDTK